MSNENGNEKKRSATMWVLAILIVLLIAIIVGLFIMNVMAKRNETEGQIIDGTEQEQQALEGNDDQTQGAEVNPLKQVSSMEWVYDAIYDKILVDEEYETNYGTKYYAKDIVVPYININSEDANKANEEIKGAFQTVVDAFNEGVQNSTTYIDECGYKSFINGDILSVVLTYGIGGTDVVYPVYHTYNFNLTNGKLVDFQTGYKAAKFESDTITSKVEEAITSAMNGKLSGLKAEDYPEGASFDTYNNESIANYKKSVEDGTIQYYLDSEGKLNIVVKLVYHAGRGWVDTIISL